MKPGPRPNGELSESYNAIHIWLRTYYGRGLVCIRCGEKGKKTGRRWSLEYALKPNHTYKRDRNSFDMLCKSCHRKQDMNEEILAHMRKGWEKRKATHGLNKTDKVTGRFVKKKTSGASFR